MKIKLNWGAGIVLAFVGFISFIMYFVITMSLIINTAMIWLLKIITNKNLEYQEKIDATKNAKILKKISKLNV